MKAYNDLIEIARSSGNFHLGNPIGLWLALAILLVIPLWKSLGRPLPNSFIGGHNIRSSSWTSWFTAACLTLAWLAFSIALSEPYFTTTEVQSSYQAREFEVLIDNSGSMFSQDVDDAQVAEQIANWEKEMHKKYLASRSRFPALYPVATSKEPEPRADKSKAERFALARYAAWHFVKSRLDTNAEALKAGLQCDRVGIGTFDDEVHPAYPLTSELNIPLRKVEYLSAKSGGGTNFEGPSESDERIGAFQYCINEFKQWGKKNVKTKVMILISDGDAGIGPERHEQLVKQMTEPGMDIHVYALVCGPKTQLKNGATESMRRLIEAVNPKDAERPEFQQAVIWAGDGAAMQNAFDTINKLEKSSVEGEPISVDREVSHPFIVAGAALSALFLLAAALFKENL